MGMHRIAKIAIVVNLVLVVWFVLSNLFLWNQVNGWLKIGSGSQWSVFSVVYEPLAENAHLASEQVPNFPFWIFFAALAVNLFFIYKLSKGTDMH